MFRLVGYIHGRYKTLLYALNHNYDILPSKYIVKKAVIQLGVKETKKEGKVVSLPSCNRQSVTFAHLRALATNSST